MKSAAPLDLAILVPSFDGVAEVWPIFIEAFFRAWPDCPYRVYIGTNTRDVGDPRVTTIKVGPDPGYADTILAMLDQVTSEWVLLGLEDFPCAGPVNVDAIHHLACVGQQQDAAFINLIVLPGEMATLFQRPVPGGDLAEMTAGDPYCIALGGGLWKSAALRQCLVPGESAWQIERVGSWRVRGSGLRFFRLGRTWRQSPPFPIVNLIESRLWTRRGQSFARTLGIGVDLSSRPLEPRGRRLYLDLYQSVRYVAASVLVTLGRGAARRYLARTVGEQKMRVQNRAPQQ